MDSSILIYIQEFIRNDILDPVMVFITHTGDYGVLWIALVLLLIIIPKTRILGHVAGFSLAIESVINNLILKPVVARIRPYEVIEELILMIEEQKDYSFPSGHSGAAFAVAGAFFFALVLGIPGLSSDRRYKVFTIVVLIYATLLSFSRLYVGVHYPTDVLAGIALGLLSGVAGYYAEKKLRAVVYRAR
ncbi:MAG: phosphatase PAP2 family protein [Clostridiales bacterium]|nr:phosphatase PAP2 family protein [Clostridiales bacterium]